MIIIYIILTALTFVFHAFFTFNEMAITSLDRIKLKTLVQHKNKQAIKLHNFITSKYGFLGTTLVGTNISVVISAALVTRIFTEILGKENSTGATTLFLVPITLIFAEIIPKSYARQNPTKFALITISFLKIFHMIFMPLIVATSYISSLLLKPLKTKHSPWDIKITKIELENIISSGRTMYDVEDDEVELLQKIITFAHKEVSAVMIPLYRVYSISLNDTIGDLKKIVYLTGFSRIPVYENILPSLNGIMYSEYTPKAIVNGKIVTTGDLVHGFQVMEILKDRIFIEKNGQKIELELD
ncbi:MAG: DUF21 domain-containing protein [Candidatus Omnitrophica bacterium]|nr:DUF21 domain-containing protein [Candidatus Omnitrophota bacterium]